MNTTKKVSLFLLSFCFTIVFMAQNDADIVVDINGAGDFTSIQAAIDAAPSNSAEQIVIFIKRGLYDQEKLIVPAFKSNIAIIGESREETIISYDVYNCNDGGDGMCPDNKVALWTSNSDLVRTAATLTIQANDFRAENITIENTAGPVGQAQAITLQADRNVFVNCNITGYQDTIYFWMAETSRAYFESCMILGRTDYIYGRGVGFFNACEIRSFGGAWITAPSSTENQDYGFVFYKCDLTYQPNSPRPGDDGAKIKFGRPWHEYPKVAWLYCNMPAEIDPLGWGDKWNMDYADTDTRLHLYEWMNEGPGADMSSRADWAGLRAMTNQAEANLYEPEIVLAGSDNWDPTAIAPAVTVYNWTGNASTNEWLEAENWNPEGVPSSGEVGQVDGDFTINASGGDFLADLNVSNGATLNVAASSHVTLLNLKESTIATTSNSTLTGAIKTKGDITINSSQDLDLQATLTGVHQVTFNGSVNTLLNTANDAFSGEFVIENGNTQAKVSKSLGSAKKITIKTDGRLTVDVSDAIFTSTALYSEGNATLVLNDNIVINEWYVDGRLQDLGTYNSENNSAISGSGSLVIGRPSAFNFLGGNWDDPNNFSPALLPESGEKVIVDGVTIEAQSTPFLGDMFVQNNGTIRLRRQDSESLGSITMYQNTSVSYATSGPGFTLKAPIVLEGDIALLMNSSHEEGSVMNLPGTFKGDYNIRVESTRDAANTATVALGGDNSFFTGTWDLTKASPNTEGAVIINGLVENAFGEAKIMLNAGNLAVFNHPKCAGNNLNISVYGNAKALLNHDIVVGEFILNDEVLEKGTYNATTHPEIFSGTGSIILQTLSIENMVILESGMLKVKGNLESLEIYNLLGQRVYKTKSSKEIDTHWLRSGIYVISFKVDGKLGKIKVYKN